MDSLRKTAALVFIALWALMSNHCGLEAITGLEVLACSSSADDESGHLPADCGDEDACATVESGLYKPEEGRVAAAAAPDIDVSFVSVLALEPSSIHESERPVTAGPSPPGLAQAWQFSSRAALPPRAPSLLL